MWSASKRWIAICSYCGSDEPTVNSQETFEFRFVFHCSTFDLCFIAFPATAVAAVVTCAAAACAAATCAAFVAKVSIGARSGRFIGL